VRRSHRTVHRPGSTRVWGGIVAAIWANTIPNVIEDRLRAHIALIATMRPAVRKVVVTFRHHVHWGVSDPSSLLDATDLCRPHAVLVRYRKKP